jgi:hypothetical protein
MTFLPRVSIAFDLNAAGQGTFFTIGDPVQGELGASAYPLLGPIPVDVTDFVRSLNIRRGRTRELDRIDAGACSFTLDNTKRTFDPRNIGFTFNQPEVLFDDPDVTFNDLGFGSPFAPSMTPRKAVTVEIAGSRAYTGQIEDFDLIYDVGNDSVCQVKCSDGFTLLTARQLAGSAFVQEDTGDRVTAVLNDPGVAWPPARRDIDSGTVDVAAQSIGDNVNALTYLQEVNASEPGLLFIGKDGFVRFRNRSSLQALTDVVFSDEGDGIPFMRITNEVGTESLFNEINVEFASGKTTAFSPSSQTKYGTQVLNYKTLLSASADAEALAEFYSRKFSEPVSRIIGLEIALSALPDTDKAAVLALELGDLVTVKFTPNRIGDRIQQASVIEAIEHQVTPKFHVMRFNLSTGLSGFIIGESLLGQESIGF